MLLFNIDGPKGSGKSTLASELSKYYNAKHKYFDSENVVTDRDFDLNELNKNVIFERGLFSYMIYGFLWNAQQDFKVSRYFNEMRIKTWTPLSEMHFEELYRHVKYYSIILYSSDEKLLFDRIVKRKSETGKGATNDELQQLSKSNSLFKLWGEYYYKQFPSKTLLVDISQYQSFDELFEYIINKCKEIDNE